MSELKACFKCGSPDGMILVSDGVDRLIGRKGDVFCKHCQTKHPIDTWNHRPIEDQLRAELEEYKKSLKVSYLELMGERIIKGCEFATIQKLLEGE